MERDRLGRWPSFIAYRGILLFVLLSAPVALAIIGVVAVYYNFRRTPDPRPSDND